ncbi:hypothetical protein HDU83_006121 [Entophlyctis luteolus]|nr:hypothetical protein HDU83_006121 [Entophlyctis luteolus]
MGPKATNKKKFVPLNQAVLPSAPSPLARSAASFPVSEVASATSLQTQPEALAPHPAALRAAAEAERNKDDSDIATDFCFICTDPISWYAVGECNHRVCHLCSLRLRALLKDNNCSLCKTTLSDVIYTANPTKPYSEFQRSEMPKMDKKLSIYFDTMQAFEDVMILLRFNCPDPECDESFPGGWNELKKHVRQVHNKFLCDLCTRHKKLFTHEHSMYTQIELDRHFRKGDANDPSFKGHPKCGFCNIYFYGDDELYEHCRKSHEQCFLCVGVGIRHQYYENYERLENHFQKDHYCCTDPECLEKKFQVFYSDIDLKAHEIAVHPTKKTARGKGQKIDVNFSIVGSPSIDLGSRGSVANNSGSNRNANNRSSNRREDRGSQRELSDQVNDSARSSVARPPAGFGQLTAEVAPTPGESTTSLRESTSTSSVNDPMARYAASVAYGVVRSDESFPPPQRATIGSNGSNSSLSSGNPLDSGTLTSLQDLFQSDRNKLDELKSLAKLYRSDMATCAEFLNLFVNLVYDGRTDLTESAKNDLLPKLGRVWKSLADSLPEGGSDSFPSLKGKKNGISKKEEMMRTWNDFRSKGDNTYSNPYSPSSYANPVASNQNPASAPKSASPSSARVLVIKSKASHQRANTPMWNAMAKGKGFVSSLEDKAKRPAFDTPGRSSSVEPDNIPIDSSSESVAHSSPDLSADHAEAATMWGSDNVQSQPAKSGLAREAVVVSSSSSLRSEFPGLPSRPSPVPPFVKKGSDTWRGGFGNDSQSEQQQQAQQQQQGKQKKKKIVLMSIGL